MNSFEANYAVMALLALLGFFGTLAAYFIARIITWGPSHPFKRARYEAGNPPRRRARVSTIPQYYGYIIIFIVLDPLFALLFLTPPSSALNPLRTLMWVALVSVILIPPLLYALHYAERIEYWVWDRRGMEALRRAHERRRLALIERSKRQS
ncbi:hypothetical protein Pyrfu_0865 [Pyrolobus fumarii 1A]|uniref:NADH-ubiquinone/plastoquinone oxidoreductase chain 3 n=1 Tax=Pyrolobus fumarii (strain DSM 11204 / 1A) TaxID=694429 RepID=G0EDW5_PYRF1|nr:NADH-quinone oxidoreductase subunit A [Pyrolobus fumarii]AEM38734.1 hypothetical protein Pyrfu_0865 [Pyrolobus fumarii 1A]